MKKFRFTLEKLKDYREKILENEKNRLGILRRELTELQTELEIILNLINLKNDELALSLREGTLPFEIAVKKRYIASLQQQAIEKRGEISKKEAEVEKQLEVVLEATKDLSMLEKLEETQLEAYRAAEQKENELFIEEFVSNKTFREENAQK